MSPEKRLKQLGIELGAVSAPVANYVNVVRTGNLLFLAGKGPRAVDGARPKGKVGREDMKAIQADVELLDAQVFVPFITAAMANARIPGAAGPQGVSDI